MGSRKIKILLLKLALPGHEKYFKNNFKLFRYQKLISRFIQMKSRRKCHYKKRVGRGF